LFKLVNDRAGSAMTKRYLCKKAVSVTRVDQEFRLAGINYESSLLTTTIETRLSMTVCGRLEGLFNAARSPRGSTVNLSGAGISAK